MSECIYHRHHIIPRHAGGTDDPSNIVELTIEEHAEAHRKLYEEHGRWQDRIAWLGLAGLVGRDELLLEVARETGKKLRGRPKSKEHRAKIGASRKGKKTGPLSEEHKAKISASNKGKVISEETREKIRAANKGQIFSEETRKKMSVARKNRITTEETRTKMSVAQTGRKHPEEIKAKISSSCVERYKDKTKNPMYGRKHTEEALAKMRATIECPHCSKVGGKSNMKRYHFDNCKKKG